MESIRGGKRYWIIHYFGNLVGTLFWVWIISRNGIFGFKYLQKGRYRISFRLVIIIYYYVLLLVWYVSRNYCTKMYCQNIYRNNKGKEIKNIYLKTKFWFRKKMHKSTAKAKTCNKLTTAICKKCVRDFLKIF